LQDRQKITNSYQTFTPRLDRHRDENNNNADTSLLFNPKPPCKRNEFLFRSRRSSQFPRRSILPNILSPTAMPVPQISCTNCSFVAGVSSSNTHVCPSCHAATPPLTLQPPLMIQAPPTQCHPETRSYRRPPMRSATLHDQAIQQEEHAKMGLFYVPCNVSPTPQAPEHQIRRSIPRSPPYYPPHLNAQIDTDAAGQSTSTFEGKTEDNLPHNRSFFSFCSPLDRRTPSFLSDEDDDELTAPVFREHPTMSLEEALRRRTG